MSSLAFENQPILAEMLWKHGFSEDSVRNWLMAEILLADPGFHELLEKSGPPSPGYYPPNHGGVYEPYDSYNQAMAYLLYLGSFRLEYPSVDSYVNWVCAINIWPLAKAGKGKP